MLSPVREFFRPSARNNSRLQKPFHLPYQNKFHSLLQYRYLHIQAHAPCESVFLNFPNTLSVHPASYYNLYHPVLSDCNCRPHTLIHLKYRLNTESVHRSDNR